MNNNQMDPRVKTLWTDALRSGAYEQGQGSLTQVTPSGEKDCCLGVLCKLAMYEGLINRALANERLGTFEFGDYMYGSTNQTTWLPPEVAEWAGLHEDTDPHAGDCSLSSRNDDGGTFAQIADLIDQYL